MMMFRKLPVLIICCCGWIPAFSQYYSTGQDPASLSWRQIKTEKYRLIYPVSFSSQAQYLANVLDLVARHETTTLKARVPRIPVIIHSQSALSNGLTVWAPRRIELYPCPPQDSYAQEWLEQLAIHEYRHAVQTAGMNRGFTRILSYLFGEQATGAVLGLYIPTWFLEGDAVCTETALSNSGRGRLPAFENILRSQLLEKGIYSYDKATMGSYRNFTPDAYVLGYHLVAWGRDQFGPDLWDHALGRSAQLPFMVVPFNSGIHQVTGLSKRMFYREAMNDLTKRWVAQDSVTEVTPCVEITKRDPHNYTNYEFPVLNDSTSVIALRSDYEDPDRIVHIDLHTGKEETIITPGDYIKNALSVSGPLLAWSEYVSDARWSNRNYAVIRIHNMETGKTRYLTRKSRYFFPALSPDSRKVAAVQVDIMSNCSLDILDAGTGEVTKSYPFPGKMLVTEPTWSPDGEEILFCTVTDRGKSLAEIHTRSDSLIWLIRDSRDNISGPVYLSEDTIFFTASYTGIDNLCYFDETTREIFVAHSSRFGAYNPNFTPRKDLLFWSSITSDGLMLRKSRVETEKWTHVDHTTNHSIRLYEPLAAQEQCNIQDSVLRYGLDKLLTGDTTGMPSYPEKRYSKLSHLFLPHSWAPVALDATNLDVQPGVSVISQNELSTMTAEAGYRYHPGDHTGKIYGNLTYSGLYPEMGVSIEYGEEARYVTDTAGNSHRYTWNISDFSANVSIPWNLSRGKYSRYLTPRINTGIVHYIHNPETPAAYFKGFVWHLDYALYAANYQFSNFKDMYPRFGQNIYIVYKHGPFGGYDPGSILGCEVNLYFPGFFKHHGIRLYAGGQQRWESRKGENLFSDILAFPRGTTSFYTDKMFSLSAGYKLPLCYPDWSIGSLMYIKRFKLNLFYDYAEGTRNDHTVNSSSAGAELTADFHLLRFIYPFEAGVRSCYLPGDEKWRWEMMVGITF